MPYKQFVWILFEFEESLFFYPVTLWKGNEEIRTSSNLLQVLLLVLAYYLNPTISATGVELPLLLNQLHISWQAWEQGWASTSAAEKNKVLILQSALHRSPDDKKARKIK